MRRREFKTPDTGFVKKKCDNKGMEHFSQKWMPVL